MGKEYVIIIEETAIIRHEICVDAEEFGGTFDEFGKLVDEVCDESGGFNHIDEAANAFRAVFGQGVVVDEETDYESEEIEVSDVYIRD